MKRTFQPKRGLLFFLVGFPAFFGAKLLMQYAMGDASEVGRYAIWSLMMAATFGLLATFTKVFGR